MHGTTIKKNFKKIISLRLAEKHKDDWVNFSLFCPCINCCKHE